MKTIFVMVKCDLGQAYNVADAAVGEIEQVSEVYSTSGQYDLLMKCYLPDSADIGQVEGDQDDADDDEQHAISPGMRALPRLATGAT